jgi:hypothetical protein
MGGAAHLRDNRMASKIAPRAFSRNSSVVNPRRNLTRLSYEFVEERIRPANTAYNPEEILQRSNTMFRGEQSQDLRGVVAEKIQDLRHYDVLAMETVVAIMNWGRSGSLLLSSYLDGHADVMMLPEIWGQKLYDFFDHCSSLSLRDKLIGYAAFEPRGPRFFDGAFAISPTQYYAAIQALLEFYAEWPSEFMESRRCFFLFVHIAYNLALGRRPAAGSHPLIVHALHDWDNVGARYLVEDFPQAKFVHTVRDPISSCNGMFQYLFGGLADPLPRTYIKAPYSALSCLTDKDRPHFGMESRTRTIRFEDLHRDTAETMRKLADWLGLSYQPTLLDSTFNGIQWVVKRDGKTWSGPRSEQIQRHSENLSRKDRALLFALFHENFMEWNYPCPKIFRYLIVRCIVFVSLILVPMKMEVIAARATFKRKILPAARRWDIWQAIRCLLGIAFCRLKIIGLLTPAFYRRCVHPPTLLQVDDKSRPLARPDDVQSAASSETNCRGSSPL